MAMIFKEFPSPLQGMRVWGADAGECHFIITHEDGTTLKSDADRKKWVGYTASFKLSPLRDHQPTRITGLWQSFAEAEAACYDTLRLLNLKHQ